MSEPTEQPATEAAVEPVPEPTFTITKQDLTVILKEAIKEAVTPLQVTVDELSKANQQLQEDLTKMSSISMAEGVPQHLRGGDPRVSGKRADIAMSVTLATRPVVENPDQYDHIVSPGGLTRVTLQELIADIDKGNGTT